ncbi:MAG: hypothetical protein IKR19_08910 [Acholeplasmatales bacterium]|nr:hypothetical protein [Acholeplasmatales bacterium]
MSNSTMKTYKDSYLYKTKLRQNQNDENRNNKAIADFIMNSNRIDKNSEAFTGIVEQIKRQQSSKVVYAILNRPDVHLCINNYELPQAFKVFDAKDGKNGKANAIFIDCTGLVEYKNGYFSCRNIGVLITYLYDAMVYLLYRYANYKLMNHSEITISSTACYVSLFTYVIDYLRIIGYAENKVKISYLVGLFYLNNLMGKDLDNYTKNIAAKVSGLELRSISAYDLYLEEGIFSDINTFINYITKTFNLKGFNLEVFISRWMYIFGRGTQYATELFTSSAVLLCNAYAGTYVVQHKQIDKACGLNMIKFNNAIRGLGDSNLAAYMESVTDYKDKSTVAFAESFKETLPKCNKAVFSSIDESVKLADAYKKFQDNPLLKKVVPKAVVKFFTTGMNVLEAYVNDGSNSYEEGALCACKELLKVISANPQLNNEIHNNINIKMAFCKDKSSNVNLEQADRQRASRCLVELMELKNAM